jgi:hypothetical protein
MAAPVNQEAQALADLQQAVTDIGTAIAAEILALQNAMNAQGVNNTPAIEASVQKIRDLVGALNQSLTPPVVTPAAPTITSLSPSTGSVNGGDTVTVAGTGLTGATVTVGGLPATSVRVASDTSLTFVTPASVAGPANAVITTPNGTVSSTFTYA